MKKDVIAWSIFAAAAGLITKCDLQEPHKGEYMLTQPGVVKTLTHNLGTTTQYKEYDVNTNQVTESEQTLFSFNKKPSTVRNPNSDDAHLITAAMMMRNKRLCYAYDSAITSDGMKFGEVIPWYREVSLSY